MDHSGLVDIGFTGDIYTWNNKRVGGANIKQRLDRVLENIEWRLIFPKAILHHLTINKSDHKPIMLEIRPTNSSYPKPYATWLTAQPANK